MSAPVVVYPARRVVTMDPSRPTAEAVAVRGDRVLAVGGVEELSAFGPARTDDRYADAVLFPGFVEAHAHASSGAVWRSTYVGWFDRTDPDGRTWTGCRSIEEVLSRLVEVERALTDPTAPLQAWGLDPIYFTGERLVARHLDRVSTTRPIYVQHANGHLATVNTALMRADGIDATSTVEGVARGADGEPNGELQEFAAMALAASVPGRSMLGLDREALRVFGREACRTGTTTVVDLASSNVLADDAFAVYTDVVAEPGFPARIAPFHLSGMAAESASEQALAETVATLRRRAGHGLDKLFTGYVKVILDGSIQGFTARLLAPGYLGREDNGIWILTPERFESVFAAFHRAGMLIHVHCNGDEATELMLEVAESVLTRYPRPDHRHTVTHSQLSTAAQYRRMAALGLCANLFSNHIWYWGDQHLDVTVGPDRARRMNAAATAIAAGVPITLHSDSPVTPLGPLATASYAVERRTATGRDFGAGERISVDQALRAITLGAAYTLKLDDRIGSIEGGKLADLAVLDADPTAVEHPAQLRDIAVLGTVVGGEHHTGTPG